MKYYSMNYHTQLKNVQVKLNDGRRVRMVSLFGPCKTSPWVGVIEGTPQILTWNHAGVMQGNTGSPRYDLDLDSVDVLSHIEKQYQEYAEDLSL